MKRIIAIVWSGLLLLSFNSCELFELDNYDEPAETIWGEVVDVATGERVLTDQGSEGTRIRLRELSWTETAVPNNFDFQCMKEGIFQNTKVFEGYYNVRIDGAFVPLVRLNQQGDTIFDGSLYTDIKGVTKVKFEVQPFLKVEWIGEPVVSEGKITAQFKVTRALSPAEFKDKIEPMGGYNDNFLNVTDVRLFVSQVQYVGYREWDNRYSVERTFEGDAFNVLLGEPVTITTNGVIPSGRTVFIRAAARINYQTENIARHNYNEAKRVDIP
ncbi:MAG: DUF3823 domain-containing protein [Tannerellaceae bacterium]|nr:DUF3823 domain-containing protein [Tannerellaceae bacterium]